MQHFRRSWPFLSFNSRPHKEVDYRPDAFATCWDLSIHDLTRRSTANIHNIFLYSHRLFIPLYKSFSFFSYFCLKFHPTSPIIPYIPGANLLTFSVHSAFALKDQRLSHIKTGFYSNMLYFVFIFISQIIKSQTVRFLVYDIFQNSFHLTIFR